MVRIYRKINYTSTVLFLIVDYQFIIKKNFINLSLLFMYPFLESFTKQQIIISRLSNNIYIYIYWIRSNGQMVDEFSNEFHERRLGRVIFVFFDIKSMIKSKLDGEIINHNYK